MHILRCSPGNNRFRSTSDYRGPLAGVRCAEAVVVAIMGEFRGHCAEVSGVAAVQRLQSLTYRSATGGPPRRPDGRRTTAHRRSSVGPGGSTLGRRRVDASCRRGVRPAAPASAPLLYRIITLHLS